MWIAIREKHRVESSQVGVGVGSKARIWKANKSRIQSSGWGAKKRKLIDKSFGVS